MAGFCTKCGAALVDGATSCPVCGAPVSSQAAPAATPAYATQNPTPAYASAANAAAGTVAQSGNVIVNTVTKHTSTMDMVGKFGMLGASLLLFISCFIPFYNVYMKAETWWDVEVIQIKLAPLFGKISEGGTSIGFPFMGWFIFGLSIATILMVLFDKKVPAMILAGINAGMSFITFIVILVMTAVIDASFKSEVGMSLKDVYSEYKRGVLDIFGEVLKFTYSKGPTAAFIMIGMLVLIVSMVIYGANHKRRTA